MHLYVEPNFPAFSELKLKLKFDQTTLMFNIKQYWFIVSTTDMFGKSLSTLEVKLFYTFLMLRNLLRVRIT